MNFLIPWPSLERVETLEKHLMDIESEQHAIKIDLKELQENFIKLNNIVLKLCNEHQFKETVILNGEKPKKKPGRKPAKKEA